MMRLASSLAVGDTVGPRDAVVVAIEPLDDDMLRLTLFVDGGVVQQDAHQADTFDNVKSPPMLVDALGALAAMVHRLTHSSLQSFPLVKLQDAAEVLNRARLRGIMRREFGVYKVRKS